MFSEKDVDRELKAALSVSPSPDFAARVLQRVETDGPSRSPAHYGWFAAAASVIVVTGAFYALSRTSAVVAPAPAQSPHIVVRTPPPSVAPPHRAPAREDTIEPRRVATVRASRSPRGTGQPEVLVPRDRMEAVRRLVRAVNEGRIAPPAEPLQDLMALPASVGVTPLVIEPIPLPPIDPRPEPPAPFIRRSK